MGRKKGGAIAEYLEGAALQRWTNLLTESFGIWRGAIPEVLGPKFQGRVYKQKLVGGGGCTYLAPPG